MDVFSISQYFVSGQAASVSAGGFHESLIFPFSSPSVIVTGSDISSNGAVLS